MQIHRLTRAAGFEVPPDSGRKIALARLISNLAPTGTDVLLWVTGWGVWPSCENWDLFYGYRRSLGETRRLIDAPLHVVGAEDRNSLVSLVSLVLLFGWDAQVVSRRRDFMLTISHDEWLEVRTTCQPEASEAVRELEAFGLSRVR